MDKLSAWLAIGIAINETAISEKICRCIFMDALLFFTSG